LFLAGHPRPYPQVLDRELPTALFGRSRRTRCPRECHRNRRLR
jgi:hypothetical protein